MEQFTFSIYYTITSVFKVYILHGGVCVYVTNSISFTRHHAVKITEKSLQDQNFLFRTSKNFICYSHRSFSVSDSQTLKQCERSFCYQPCIVPNKLSYFPISFKALLDLFLTSDPQPWREKKLPPPKIIWQYKSAVWEYLMET